jgi:hypothetical protein
MRSFALSAYCFRRRCVLCAADTGLVTTRAAGFPDNQALNNTTAFHAPPPRCIAPSGTTAPPCAVFSSSKTKPSMPGMPASGSWLWQDMNGDTQPSADEYLEFPGLAFCEYTMLSIDVEGGIWWRVSNALNHDQRELL